MKAAVNERYGGPEVVEVQDIERPEIGDNEILIKVYAAAVTTADWRLRASEFPLYAWLPGRLVFGLFRPKAKVRGSDFAGRVVAKGKSVTRFKGGDEVFGMSVNGGAHADYIKMAEDAPVIQKPAGITYEQAAAVPFGALTALVFLRDFAKLQSGQRVLVNGASGGVGVFVVQLAKHFGAIVTAVCSGKNHEMVRSLGADHVIDYTKGDALAGDAQYDLIFDTVGKFTFKQARRALSSKGIFLPIEFNMREIIQACWTGMRGGQKVMVGVSGDKLEDLTFIRDLMAEGALTSIIDSTYDLDDIRDAHRRVESRRKRGAVIVNLPSEPAEVAALPAPPLENSTGD